MDPIDPADEREWEIHRAFEKLKKEIAAKDARLALLEKRDTEAVKIIMAVVGNSLLNDPIFSKLLARARAFYDNAERRG
jgi:hypothetical protein